MTKIIKRILVTLTAIAITTISLSSCTLSTSQSDRIVLGNFSYESCVVSNKILEILIEQGYERDVETIQVETSSGMTGLERGDISATSELWLDNRREWFNEVNNKTVVDLSSTYSGNVEQGWYVPQYVIDLNPQIHKVSDLVTYKESFKYDKDSETKGTFLNAPSGWNSSIITEKRFKGYGLSDYYNLVDPGSGSGLDMTISSYYEKKIPFVTYYWEPTWLLGSYKMVKLEENPYEENLWNEENNYLCSYPEPEVKVLANKKFVDNENNKDIVEVLKQYTIEASAMNQILSKAKESNDSEYLETIKNFMKENSWWESFVTKDALVKINSYLGV